VVGSQDAGREEKSREGLAFPEIEAMEKVSLCSPPNPGQDEGKRLGSSVTSVVMAAMMVAMTAARGHRQLALTSHAEAGLTPMS
jgi:hypothetical protein